ncbi:MAG: Secretion system C-terminal sorting domain [Bacteroidetes bacterium]|nr:Secretion system C-terminal sorting domain [Bacteroidota bacterium]
MNISSNEFNWLNWSTTTTQQSVNGIIVNNAVVNTVGSLLLNRNNIANLQKGITLTLQGYTGSGTAGRVIVFENQIRFNQLQTSTVAVQHYGVGVFGSKRITVDGDNSLGEIIRVTISASSLNNTTTQRDLFSGIRIEDSPESWITDMNIANVPASIYAKGACTTSDFWCNTFTGAYNGVYLFNNTNVGDQLNLTTPNYHAATGNQWISTTPAGGKVEGNPSPPINWYYSTSGGANFNPLPSIFATNVTFLIADNTSDACAFQTSPEDPGDPDGRLAASSADEPEPEAPKKSVEEPETGSNSTNARTFDDEPQLELYPAYLDSMGIEAAATYNALIATENEAEAARKQVDEIHLRSWAQGISYFTATDSAYLCQLVIEDPATFGSAVYSAQVMVGECYGGGESARLFNISAETLQIILVSRGRIYPNPNDGLMQAEFTLKDAERGTLEILSLSGNKLSSYMLNAGSNNFVIDESKLQAGIYLYRITINGSVIEIKKLVIVK